MASLKVLTKRTSKLRRDVDRLIRRTSTGGTAWSAISGKPSTFPPSAHTQAISTIVGLEAALTSLSTRVDARQVTRHRAAIAFQRKLANGSRVSVVTIGDSKMEGSGVSVTSSRSQNRMLDALRAAMGMTGAGWDMGRGYIPAKYETFFGFSDAPTLVNAVGVSEGGLGGRSVSVEKPGTQAGVIDFGNLDFGTATAFQVAYTRRPDTALVEVLIDNAVATTINTNNATYVWGGLATVTLPSGGIHNIKIRQTGDYVARIEGIIHRTASQGITLYDGCRSGAQTGFYTPGTSNPDRVWQSMSTVCQDVGVVVCALGANDMASISVTAWESNLRAIVNKARQVWPTAGFLFLMAAERIEDANVVDSTKHAEFTAAARRVMEEFEHTSFMEEAAFWQPLAGGSVAAQDPLGWLADTVHYGVGAGHVLGRALAHSILGS